MDDLQKAARDLIGVSRDLTERLRVETVEKVLERVLDIPEEQYLHIAALAAQICDTPVAAVSLIDNERTIYKALITGTPNPQMIYKRTDTLCNLLTKSPDQPVVIYDAVEDSRVSGLPFVDGGYDYLRFYSGLPLVTKEEYVVGTICVADRAPRSKLRADQEAAMHRLRDLTIRLLDC